MRPSRSQASQEPSEPPPTGRRPIAAPVRLWSPLGRVGRRARRRLAMAACVVLLCGLPLDAMAQHLFDSWTTENGLPQNSVNDILQTRDGYLWLATHGGLVRFDGVRFVVFDRSTPGIGSQRIRALHEDRQGSLWAGTEDGMLIRHRDGSFTTYTNEDGLPHGGAVRIEEDEEGSLWVAWYGALTRFDGRRFFKLAADDFAHGVRPPPNSHYLEPWSSYDSTGLHVLVKGRVLTYSLGSQLPAADVTGLNWDSHGNLWIRTRGAGVIKATDGRLERYTTHEGLPTNHPDGAFYEGREGAVWFYDRRGSNVYRIAGGKHELINLIGIRAFYVDRDGSTWLGTVANGLYRLRDRAITVFTEREGLSWNWVYSILQDRTGTVWVGTGGGLNSYAQGRFRSYRGALPSDNVTSLYEDAMGRLWVGTSGGLAHLENGRFKRYDDGGDLLKGAVRALHHDRAGTYWFATDDGLVSSAEGRFTKYTTRNGLSHNRITALFEARNGALWIGTFRGVTRLKDGVFTAYTEQDGLIGTWVRAFHEDSDGILWIGTYDGGLYRLADERLTRYTRSDGLHDNGVFQILEDDNGFLWMGSNRGISRVRRDELNEFAGGRRRSIRSSVFGTGDGLVSVEVNGGSQPSGLKSADGKLWFPTMGGVAVVDPVTFRDDTPPPAAVIEEVLLAGEPIDLSRGVTIPSTFSAFDIQYSAPSFIKPSQVRFRYRLVGLDDGWVDAGDRRFASFYRIPPGKYRFVVTASSHNGVWNTDGRSLDITILPPFWRTWWFMALATIGLISIAVAAHEHRMRRLRVEHTRQLAFSQQLIDSQEDERRRLSNEMHDSLGQHVTIIKKRTRTARENIVDRERVAVELDEIGILAEQMKVEMKAIGHDLRPYHLDKIGLSKTIEKMAQRVGGACELDVATDIAPIDDLIPVGSQIHIYRIVQESLHNIVKHANATQVRVTVARGASAIQITVQDNGHGFDAGPGDAAGPADRGFGLMSIRERARILGGTVEIRSGDRHRTAVVLTLPLEGAGRA